MGKNWYKVLVSSSLLTASEHWAINKLVFRDMTRKRIAILQSNYIPWKGYFDLIRNVDEFIILDDVQFTKNDWRNRNKIKTRTGLEWLTIPVRQEKLDQSISRTQTLDGRWADKHWRSLIHSYGRSPYFSRYAETIEAAYAEGSHLRSLSAINLLFIKLICGLLDINTVINTCSAYVMLGNRVDRLVNICKQASANEYLSGPAARDYIDESMFQNADISIKWADYTQYLEYPQMFPPFQHQVTIFDLLFNTGPHAQTYLKNL